jgi:hypothetical protein
MITRNTQVEEIVKLPGIISYCIEQGVSLITCDGAFPQTLGRLLEIKKVPDPDGFINSLNAYLGEQGTAVDEQP